MTFEEKMNRLEEIAEQIKSGSAAFSLQLELFQEGVRLADEVEKELNKAEKLIEEISPSDQGTE